LWQRRPCSAGAVAVALKWDDIVAALRGKRLAVLGARGVGKTHLIEFLTKGLIPTEYTQTVAPTKTASRRFELKDLDLKIKETIDVPGDKSAYAVWKKLHDEAHVVFYLLGQEPERPNAAMRSSSAFFTTRKLQNTWIDHQGAGAAADEWPWLLRRLGRGGWRSGSGWSLVGRGIVSPHKVSTG
jgi:hypothetical protein